MKQILIANDPIYGNGITPGADYIDSVSNLTASSIIAYNMNDANNVDSGLSIDGVTPSITGDEILFAVGATPTPLLSNSIDRVSAAYNKFLYQSPTTKVMAFGTCDTSIVDNLNTIKLNAITTGDVYGFAITDLDKPHENLSRYRQYEYVVQPIDDQNAILNSIVGLINSDVLSPATATIIDDGGGNYVGVRFTGKVAGKNFSVQPMYKMIGTAPLVETTEYSGTPTTGIVNGVYCDTATLASVYGSSTLPSLSAVNKGDGLAAHIAQIEEEYSVRRGNLNAEYMLSSLWKEPSHIVPGETYITYIITWKTPTQHPGHEDDSVEQELIIAIPSANTAVEAAIDNILALL